MGEKITNVCFSRQSDIQYAAVLTENKIQILYISKDSIDGLSDVYWEFTFMERHEGVGQITYVDFSATQMLSGSNNGNIIIWDTAEKKLLKKITNYQECIKIIKGVKGFNKCILYDTSQKISIYSLSNNERRVIERGGSTTECIKINSLEDVFIA